MTWENTGVELPLGSANLVGYGFTFACENGMVAIADPRYGSQFPGTYYENAGIALYDPTSQTVSNGESFEAVIEVIRMENLGEIETTYGCRFVGINSEDQFKIEVYQIVYESNNN